MHRLVKRALHYGLHGCIETTRLARCNIWIMHHRNCILQDARGRLFFAICNVFKMHYRKHGLRDASDWFPLQECKAHPDVSVCRVVEGLSSGQWVGEGEDGETLINNIFFFFFRSEVLLSFNFAQSNIPKMLT